ncbi:uncharacterized protein LY79DRAFT_653710 [Colletotrichum navitas]|uniref:Zn(2)-C6 fungal-type domain-containing protein n=1 Tax=Colletotrichum navitas TaxID=681940 RepID=A0AAD8UYP6_9PEZI|nr:uncharacterized protein LY79DRAFT_653710 [Colletotrichum navitas]KAK1569912.1 hypothetical protein LY79DRAFT_653710 [Colletotrichum navitas]
MVTRRSHTKSRNGCRDCKRRKVKCDEAYPSCFNCTRHGIPCSLSTSGASPSRTTHHSPSFTQSTSSSSPETPYQFLDVVISHAEPTPQQPTIKLWGHGLELMHHYTLHTANTISLRHKTQHVWRVIVPEIGYDCPFVAHGILAMAALHKAYLLPPERDRYLDLATSHLDAGLEGFRALLHTIDETNWQPFFCFATLVTFYVACVPAHDGGGGRHVPDITALFVFVRGVRTILEPYQERLGRTKLAPLVEGPWTVEPGDPEYENPALHHSPLPRDIFEALSRLAAFFEDHLEGDARDDYAVAVTELRKVACLVAHAGASPEISMVVFWLYRVSDGVMADVQTAAPHAMVLVSHFAVLLCAVERIYWFFQGWSRHLLDAAEMRLAGLPVFAAALEWPKKQILELYAH